MSDFFQSPPVLQNPYLNDPLIQTYLKRTLPTHLLMEIEPELKQLGTRVVHEIETLGIQAEAQPPVHIPFDPWGRRIDHIKVSEAWRRLEEIAVEEKLIAIAYDRTQGEYSRIFQFSKVYLYGPSSAIYTCPLAMTDGAARAIELYGDTQLKTQAFRHLTSSDPKEFWTAGQWMTERTGGSDVSHTSTVAKQENGLYRLYGTKWFTSATTSQIAMTLARIEGAPNGSRGLSLFYLELRDHHGHLNQIQIHRLKNKLGTHALPTAELCLNGTPAQLIAEEGAGVKRIASLFNITRIWNACSAIGFMRRGIALAQDYSTKRSAFGQLLKDQPLFRQRLESLETELWGAFFLVFRTSELLGKEETNQASISESALLRLLTPVIKLYTAKQAIAVSSEILECFGGAGYVEDTGLPKLLRDSQVLSIWEGTTDVLSLDCLRAIEKEHSAPAFLEDTRRLLSEIHHPELMGSVQKTLHGLAVIENTLQQSSEEKTSNLHYSARALAFTMARVYAGALLLSHTQWEITHSTYSPSKSHAIRWCNRDYSIQLNRPFFENH